MTLVASLLAVGFAACGATRSSEPVAPVELRGHPDPSASILGGPGGSAVAELGRTGLTVSSRWQRSSDGGTWTGTLRREFGENEVSCLLRSSTSRVEQVELRAVFARPGLHEAEILVQFRRTTMALFPGAPDGLLNAIAEQKPWRAGVWRLGRSPHPDADGHDLCLWNR